MALSQDSNSSYTHTICYASDIFSWLKGGALLSIPLGFGLMTVLPNLEMWEDALHSVAFIVIAAPYFL